MKNPPTKATRTHGHGWAGANMVFWNCSAHHFVVQDPPTAHNWLIGGIGMLGTSWAPGDEPTIDSHNHPVTPRSLYLAQLEQRLGPEALANVATSEQLAEGGSRK
jgi:hypothetical protein